MTDDIGKMMGDDEDDNDENEHEDKEKDEEDDETAGNADNHGDAETQVSGRGTTRPNGKPNLGESRCI